MSVCEFNHLLGLYHDGELPAGRKEALESHLPGCPACGQELDELRRLSAGLASAERPALLPIDLRRLHRRVAAAMDDGLLRIARVLTAVAACLLVGGSLWLMRLAAPPAPRADPDWAEVAVLPSADNPVVVAAAGDETVEQWIVNDLAGKGPVK